ncbi:MAG: CoA-acylating methylmalonate-semialdehyde dehydrogenase [Thermoplasmata archaeon]
MTEILKNYIGREWKESKSDDLKEVRNPAKDEVIAEVPMSTEREVDECVTAAKNVFEDWRNTSVTERVEPLFKFVQVLKEEKEEVAQILTEEHGKAYGSALGEMERTIQMVEGACATLETNKGEFTENISEGIDEYTVRRPLGVFATIAPFNFPAMVPWWYAPWAVAVGDTFILKASEQCPRTQQKIFELIDERIELPDGVINLINGGKGVAEDLISHSEVEGITFVGSTEVGKKIYSQAAKRGKRAQCQTGANNFLVVMPDVDLNEVMPNMMNSCFGNAGQRCLAGSIVLGVGDIYEELEETFIEYAENLEVNHGMADGVDMGPVVSKESLDKLHSDIQRGLDEGGELLLDGREIEIKDRPNGYFLGPTVFKAEHGMEIFDREIFGPVICLDSVEDLEEAIKMINEDQYGNAATIYTEKGGAAREFRNGVKIGNVGVNLGVVAPMSYYPFGGMKDSFFGDLHGQGRDIVNFFSDRQVVIRRWNGK